MSRKTGNFEYAVYRGEELLVIGTAKECADHMGWKSHRVTQYYASPSVKERRKNPKYREGVVVVKIDMDEIEVEENEQL